MSGDGIGIGASSEKEFDGSINPEGSGVDKIVEKNDDIPLKTKATLGDYLSSITKDKRYGNRFPIKNGSVDAKIQNYDGRPSPLNKGNNGAENVFASHQNENSHLNQYSNSGIGKELAPLNNVVKKGQTQGNDDASDGHELLKNIQDSASGLNRSGKLPEQIVETTPVMKRTKGVLAINRFTAGQEFANRRNNYTTRQKEFGVYDPAAPTVSIDQMSKIGKSLSLRATGEFKARTAGADPDSSAVQLGTIIPGEAQLGITRINTLDLEAREVFREIFGDDISGKLESSFDTSTDSYGNLTNALEHFDALVPTGMIALAIALITAAQIALRALLAVISLLTGGKTGKSDLLATDAIGRPFAGDYRLNNTPQGGFPPIPMPPRLLGLQEVNFDYARAVNTGIAVFFGGPRDPLGALIDTINPFGGETFKRAAESPGFYAIFVRNITRSLNTIANTIKNTSFSLNPIEVVEGVGNIIDTIRRSKVIAVMNIFAQIGERTLVLESQGFLLNDLVKGNNKISKVDHLPDNAASHVMKSRKSLSMQLAWRNSSTTTKLLLPSPAALSALVMNQKGGVVPFAYGMLQKSDAGESKVSTQNNRFTQDDVRRVEAQLDAEYVPFYFHDLRTNEIISFHAFLEALTDDYSVGHELSEGYGRVEPIYTYRNTTRSITMNFFCVATSHADMDEMYAKINKLTTLAYPQYSAGTVVRDDQGNSFVQPFSQVINGSPVIRIRLGDILRSNYSRFNLARLFGLGTDALNVNGETLAGNEADVNNILNKAGSIIDRFRNGEYVTGDVIKLRPNGSPGTSDTYGYPPAVEEGGLGSALASSIGLPSTDPVPPLTIAYPVKAEIVDSQSVYVGSTVINKYVIKVLDEDIGIVTDQGKPNYIINHSDVIIDGDVLAKALEREGATFDRDTVESEKFFSPTENVIVRSFESVGGKGLAGVIAQLGFEWLTGPWETERYGSRAPKMLKVSISFFPIHDIAPGIDSTGFNRAPIYNVGTAINSIGGDGPDDTNSGKDAFNESHRSIAGFANERSL